MSKPVSFRRLKGCWGSRFPNRQPLVSALEQMISAAPPQVTVDRLSAYEWGYYAELGIRLASAKKYLEDEMGGD
jgi:hypothetical protein